MNSIDNRFDESLRHSFSLFFTRFPDAVPRRGRLFQRRRLRGSKTKMIMEENAGEDQNNANIHKRQTIYYSDKPDSSDGRTMTIPSENNNSFFDDIFQVEKQSTTSPLFCLGKNVLEKRKQFEFKFSNFFATAFNFYL